MSTRPTPRPPPDAQRVLAEQVFAGGRSKPFAELTADEVQARAAELKAATGWGPTAKVASVAMAWAELARLMEHGGGDRCRLEPDEVARRAEKLWVVPPGGSLLYENPDRCVLGRPQGPYDPRPQCRMPTTCWPLRPPAQRS